METYTVATLHPKVKQDETTTESTFDAGDPDLQVVYDFIDTIFLTPMGWFGWDAITE